MKKANVLFFLLLIIIVSEAQVNIIPQPVSIKQPRIAAKFVINASTQIVLEGSNLEKVAGYLTDYIKKFYTIRLKTVTNTTSKNVIRLNYERLDAPVEGAYSMTVDNNGVYIAGDNEPGVFYAVQTLIQLLPIPNQKSKIQNSSLSIPQLTINDYPRFAYRGMHLDVCRHFFPVSFVKKYIDYLALHKMNYFHWHLTDDQGWRIEIKKYPRLTQVGGWRNGTTIGRYPGKGNDGIRYGGFYTQDEIKEVVKYAADRYITIIPEIEMPGHSSAAIAAYPELSCFPNESTKHPKQTAWNGDTTGKQVQQTWGVFEDVFCPSEFTFNFLQDVLDEVIALFPGPFLHAGGDECPKTSWKRSAFCQQLMKEKGIKDEHGLQSYFIQRIEKYINSKGKKLIGWDEILEGGLAPNAVVMSWRGEAGGIAAAKQKHQVIMTPDKPLYFDHSQTKNEDSVTIGGYNPIEKVYAYEPLPQELNAEQKKYILGAQANVWAEYMLNPKKVEYMIFPRMAALSEVLWSPKEKRNWKDFEKRLQTQFKRYDLWKANYSKAYLDLNASVLPTENYDGLKWVIEQKIQMPCQLWFKEQKKLVPKKDSIDKNEKFSDTKFIKYLSKDSAERFLKSSTGKKDSIIITSSGVFTCYGYKVIVKGEEVLINTNDLIAKTEQRFYFTKATGKKITLTNPPSDKYPGDGAFTLVNGIQNERGRERSNEFLGFEGTDCEAIIDLGSSQKISKAIVHTFDQPASWIWRPLYVEIFSSDDGNKFTSIATADDIVAKETGNAIMEKDFSPVTTRYVKCLVKNWGIIPEDNPGAGKKPWLFVDEIEVK